jgi:TonB-dependent SusC/RagA subfamily outer membrane receptor
VPRFRLVRAAGLALLAGAALGAVGRVDRPAVLFNASTDNAPLAASAPVVDAWSGDRAEPQRTHGARPTPPVVQELRASFVTEPKPGIPLPDVQAELIRFEDPIRLTADRIAIDAPPAGSPRRPLIIIDGVMASSRLNPDTLDRLDIASVEVIKGTQAAALYGERARNGVILIATRAHDRSTGAPVQNAASTSRELTLRAGKDAAPLIVVDGVVVGPSSEWQSGRLLDNENIESIEVIKGAAAAELYGARAASGVIVITTKRGS